MKLTVRLLLTLFAILCWTTIASAAVQEVQAGAPFEKACVLEGETGFLAKFVAPKNVVKPRRSKGRDGASAEHIIGKGVKEMT